MRRFALLAVGIVSALAPPARADMEGVYQDCWTDYGGVNHCGDAPSGGSSYGGGYDASADAGAEALGEALGLLAVRAIENMAIASQGYGPARGLRIRKDIPLPGSGPGVPPPSVARRSEALRPYIDAWLSSEDANYRKLADETYMSKYRSKAKELFEGFQRQRKALVEQAGREEPTPGAERAPILGFESPDRQRQRELNRQR